MAYTPTNWQTGDVVTADKLNHMEDGIASGWCIDLSQLAKPTLDGVEYETIRIADASGSNSPDPITVFLVDGNFDDKYFIQTYENDESLGQITQRDAIQEVYHSTIYEAHSANTGHTQLTVSGEAELTVVSTSQKNDYMFLPSSTEFKTVIMI